MGDVFGYICGAIAAFQFVAASACFLVLIRKWRSVPELWGIDWLDIVWRLERDFGVTITAADFEGWSAEARRALTAGQLWELVASKLRSLGIEPPLDGWERVQGALCEALNAKPQRVVSESRLYADLDMEYGI